MITYRAGNDLDLDDMIELYVDSTLGERRPVGDERRMARMLEEADLVITAWDGNLMVGISRCVTDWVYCTYLSDLAVRAEYQGQGIGKELVRLTREATPEATVILLAAPAAVDYYPRIGMTRHDSAWVLWPGEQPV
ncbi:MAG TPA: GNAT family N-acetyltransferase [Acidimicrobiia bacterium]|jgi:predicted N-acetyltransferase YhbS|nr:GNAT family N-acetyltransferase [Acidimicrobiia bacterium]